MTRQKLNLNKLRYNDKWHPQVRLWAFKGIGIRPQDPMGGFTNRTTVKLDFDKTAFKTVLYYAFRVLLWFKLQGFIVLKSSRGSYHILYDRKVTWNKNRQVMAWACFISSFNLPLMRYFVMQTIKGSSTLRISCKGKKKPPRIVYRFGSEENEIKNYLQFRRENRDLRP